MSGERKREGDKVGGGLERKKRRGTASGGKEAQNTPQGPKDSSELKTLENQQRWEEAFFLKPPYIPQRKAPCVSGTRAPVSDSVQPVDWSPPGSSVHGTLQAGILGRAAAPSSRGSYPRLLHCGQILYHLNGLKALKGSLKNSVGADTFLVVQRY